ncbi:MAG: ACT domain-containing protein, partial [Pseudomonadota bacterium]
HLAANGISTNAVSAFYHDHLFVPESRADEAVALLEALAQSID